jgi:PEP-CTERM motif
MNKFLLAAAFFAAAAAPAAAAQVSVETVGSVLNESLALPAEDTPGSGIAFDEFFEFTLPVNETVTVSMSDSAIGSERVTGGVLSLNSQTSTGPGPLFIPIGALLESSPLTNVIGGQEATVAPDVLSAGAYFAELSGVSGASPIHIAIDGTVTAGAVPEPSTWAMLVIGFGVMAWGAMTRKARKASSIWVDSLT